MYIYIYITDTCVRSAAEQTQCRGTQRLDFSNEAIIASEKGYLKLIYGLNQIKNIKPNTESTWNLDKWKAACFSALNDDFNTPILIAQLFEATKVITKLDLGILTLNHNDLRDFKQLFNDFITDVLGLKSHAKQSNSETINQNLMELILTLRNEARTNKDFKTSDLIRNQLKTMGIQINDTPKGTDYTITK